MVENPGGAGALPRALIQLKELRCPDEIVNKASKQSTTTTTTTKTRNSSDNHKSY